MPPPLADSVGEKMELYFTFESTGESCGVRLGVESSAFMKARILEELHAGQNGAVNVAVRVVEGEEGMGFQLSDRAVDVSSLHHTATTAAATTPPQYKKLASDGGEYLHSSPNQEPLPSPHSVHSEVVEEVEAAVVHTPVASPVQLAAPPSPEGGVTVPHDYPSFSYSIAVSQCGSRLACGEDKGVVTLWDTAKCVKLWDTEPQADAEFTFGVQFSRCGRYVVSSCGKDIMVRCVASARVVHAWRESHAYGAANVCFSRCGEHVVSVGAVDSIKKWSVVTGALDFSIPDKKTSHCLAVTSRHILSSHGKLGLKQWKLADGAYVQSLNDTAECTDLSTSECGTHAVSSNRSHVKVWLLPDGVCLRTVSISRSNTVAISVTRGFFVTYQYDVGSTFMSIETGEVLHMNHATETVVPTRTHDVAPKLVLACGGEILYFSFGKVCARRLCVL